MIDNAKRKFLSALEELPAHEQERLLLDVSQRIRVLRKPCPCGSSKPFGECHGHLTLEDALS